MNPSRWLAFSTSLLGLAWISATAGGEPRRGVDDERVRETLLRAVDFMRSISTEGGYVWTYSVDLQRRAGESLVDADHIWMQHPGTPSMGMAFLRAYAATGEARLMDAARSAALALTRAQLPSGGWHYSANMHDLANNRDGELDYKGQRAAATQGTNGLNPLYRRSSIFDDDNTQGCVRFLLVYHQATLDSVDPRDRQVYEALLRSLDGMIRAQYPNGAWPERFEGRPRDKAAFPIKPARIPKHYPQTWSPEVDYTQSYTLNDHSLRDCILTMLEAWRVLKDPRYLEAAKRGGDFLILAQLPEPQPAWSQQYNFDMEPCWGRKFEPPALVANESGGALQALIAIHLETGDARYLKPIPAALAWFARSAISPGTWARLYGLGTNQPVYGDKDGKIHHRLEDISVERQNNYSWRGSYQIPGIIAQCEELLRVGRDQFKERHRTSRKHPPIGPAQERAVSALIRDLDANGRWITDGKMEKHLTPEKVISTKVFIRNLDELCGYLESARMQRAEGNAVPARASETPAHSPHP